MGYTTVLLTYQSEIGMILDKFVMGGYNSMVEYVKVPLACCCILYITILGWATTQGWLKMTLSEVAKASLKIGIIYMFAMNWGNFSNIIITLFKQSASEMSATLLSATPISLPHLADEGIGGALQSILIEITTVGSYLWGKGGMTNLGPLFDALFIWVSGILMIVVGFFEITMAEILQSSLFVLAPLFIVFTLFKPTQSFFDRWVGALAGCSFVILLVNITIAINASIYQAIIGEYMVKKAIGFELASFVPLIVISLLAIFQILKVTGIAMGLGGSISSAGASTMVGSAVGSFVGTSMGMLRGSSQIVRGMMPKGMSDGLVNPNTKANDEDRPLKSLQNKIRSGAEQ